MLKTKSFSLGLLACILVSVKVHSAPIRHKLTFTIKGFENTKCYLGCHYGDKDYLQDSTMTDAKGNFEFSGENELPGGVYFILFKNRKYFEFIIDKDQQFSMRGDAINFFTSMKISGSEENSLFYQYLNYVAQKHREVDKYKAENNKAAIDSTREQIKRYKADFRQKHPDMLLSAILKAADEPDVPLYPKLPNGQVDSNYPYQYYKAHYFDNIDFSEDRLVRSPVLYPRIKEYLTKLTDQTPDSVIAAADYLVGKAKANKEMFKSLVVYITSSYEATDIMGMEAVFVHMVNKYYTPELAYWLSATQLEQVKES